MSGDVPVFSTGLLDVCTVSLLAFPQNMHPEDVHSWGPRTTQDDIVRDYFAIGRGKARRGTPLFFSTGLLYSIAMSLFRFAET